MSGLEALPRASRPLVAFARRLRRAGFTVAPEQTMTFLESVSLLGPGSIEDIRRAGKAILAPPPERLAEFDALFDAHFAGVSPAPMEIEDEEESRADEEETEAFDAGLAAEADLLEEPEDSGEAATAAEILAAKIFRPAAADPAAMLRRIPERLPRRHGFRLRPSNRGRTIDMRRTLRDAIAHAGDIPRIRRRARADRQRKLLLLIDVSGSMKAQSEDLIRLAHALTRRLDRVETFTFGTRLTRLTRALRIRNRRQALDAAAATVADWDGGTRIGESLGAFLSVPRFAAYARGAVTVIVSDGLERGDPTAMRDAVARLSRLSWRLGWLTPLAADPDFRPETAGLGASLPFLDDLASGADVEAVCGYLLTLPKERSERARITA